MRLSLAKGVLKTTIFSMTVCFQVLLLFHTFGGNAASKLLTAEIYYFFQQR